MTIHGNQSPLIKKLIVTERGIPLYFNKDRRNHFAIDPRDDVHIQFRKVALFIILFESRPEFNVDTSRLKNRKLVLEAKQDQS